MVLSGKVEAITFGLGCKVAWMVCSGTVDDEVSSTTSLVIWLVKLTDCAIGFWTWQSVIHCGSILLGLFLDVITISIVTSVSILLFE